MAKTNQRSNVSCVFISIIVDVLLEMDAVRKLATKRPTAKSCLNELLAVGLYFNIYYQVALHDRLFFWKK